MLVDIAKHPLAVVTERYKRIVWSAHTGNEIKKKLLKKGFIGYEKLSVPRGSVTLLKLTANGMKLIEPLGIKVKRLPKNASLEHEYYKRTGCQILQ